MQYPTCLHKLVHSNMSIDSSVIVVSISNNKMLEDQAFQTFHSISVGAIQDKTIKNLLENTDAGSITAIRFIQLKVNENRVILGWLDDPPYFEPRPSIGQIGLPALFKLLKLGRAVEDRDPYIVHHKLLLNRKEDIPKLLKRVKHINSAYAVNYPPASLY